jgi:hypothetical protein
MYRLTSSPARTTMAVPSPCASRRLGDPVFALVRRVVCLGSQFVSFPRSFPGIHHRERSTASYRRWSCDVAASGMLRRAWYCAIGNWGSANAGLAMHTGLAGHTTVHPFPLACFPNMLLSPWSFDARLVECPRRSCALNLLPILGDLTNAETAHYDVPYNCKWQRSQIFFVFP